MEKIRKNPIFKNISDSEFKDIVENGYIKCKNYTKGEIIIAQKSVVSQMGIIKSGTLLIEKLFPDGNSSSVIDLHEGDTFGEALLFGKINKSPVNISSENDSEVYFISKENLIKLFNEYPSILQSYLFLMSNRMMQLNNKIKYLSLDSIEKKIAELLLNEYIKNEKLEFEMPFSREKMAKIMTVKRPSLSRVLSKMKEDDIIDFNQKTFKIIDLESLKDILNN